MAVDFSQDFESGVSGLTFSGSTGQSSNYAHAGTNSLRLGGNSGGSATLSITVAGSGSLEFWHLLKVGGGSQLFEFKVNGFTVFSKFEFSTASDEVWAKQTYNIAAAGSYTFQWIAGSNPSQNNDPDGVYIDDILVETTVEDLNIAKATETDVARAITANVRHSLPRPTETDVARELVAIQSVALPRSTETDVARDLVASQSKALPRITETNAARALGVLVPTSVALPRIAETDSAKVITPVDGEVYYLGRVAETDNAPTIVANAPIIVELGRPTETGTARAMGIKSRSMLPVFHRYLHQR